MKLHTGKTISDAMARAYALIIKDLLRSERQEGALALNEAVDRAHNPRHHIPQRDLDLLIGYGILNGDGSMDTEMRTFILACTRKSGSGFRFTDPQTGR